MSERRRFVIVMVDYDEDDLMLVKQAFAEEGHRYDFDVDMRRLEDGAELLEYLDQCKSWESPKGPTPDFILLDLHRPGMGGREALAKVKSHPLCRRIPIIAFTTSADEADVMECYQCGGNSFRQKPFSSDTLKEMVHIIVNYWACSTQMPASQPFVCMGYG